MNKIKRQKNITENEENEENEVDENIKKFGGGLIRYKNEEGNMYYHGIGHLEKNTCGGKLI